MRRRALTLMAGLAVAILAQAASASADTGPSRGLIAFSTDVNGEPQIFTVRPNSSRTTELTFSDTGHSSSPSWSPDGRKIVFSGDQSGEWQLYVMHGDGHHRRQLTFEPGFDHLNPRFSPDGQRIVFAGCPIQQTCAIYTMNADGTGATRLTSLIWSSGDPAYSPDGTQIAYDSNKGGFLSAIWVMNADGSNQHRLTPARLEAFYPDWSPDGAHLLFTSYCCLPISQIWTMRADGSGRVQITDFSNGHQGGFATYSPNGKRIVFNADIRHPDGCCNDLFTMRLDGTHRVRVVADQPAVLLSDWGPSR